ncbi:MAG TPA: hypothetical protein VL633_02365 [Bacteroidota bacterium]|jgi:hypothetical protein|nr:hypothetical protein [Bacteroidota bacterium]
MKHNDPMKNKASILLICGMALLVSSCAKDSAVSPSSGTPSTDKEAIIRSVESDSLGEMSSADETVIDDGSPESLDKEATAIRPIRWGRRIVAVSRHINVDIIGDSIAIATITRTITGNFIIAAAYQDTSRWADTIITKPFSEQVVRKIRFRRIARTSSYLRNWIPVAITLVEGATQPDNANLFEIRSIEYSFPWSTDTVTDPANTWLRFGRVMSGIPVLHIGDSVQVTLHVSSADPDTELAVLRYMTNPVPVFGVRRVRMKLTGSLWNGTAYDRTYSATFYGALGIFTNVGRFNATVDVLSHGSLFDDARPFSNRFWGLPYIVVRY